MSLTLLSRSRSAGILAAALLASPTGSRADDAPSATQAASRPSRCASTIELRRDIERIRRDAAIPAVAVAALAEGKVVFSDGFGHTDLTRRSRVSADTRFHLASTTKALVGLALMRAVELGKVTLDDVADVENPNLPDAPITLAQLANHSSGIRDDLDGEGFYACSYHTPGGQYLDPELQGHCPEPPLTQLAPFVDGYLTPGGLLYDASHWASGPDAVPGTTFSYSNVGVAALGRAVETRLGRSLQGFVTDQVVRPLGLRATTWDPGWLAHAAKPHVLSDGEVAEFPDYRLATWPDGGLFSSARDLARVLALVAHRGALDGKRILKAASIDRLLEPTAPIPPEQGGYGVLWETLGAYVGHGGDDPGATARMYVRPRDGVGVVLLANVGFVSDPPDDAPWPVALGTIVERLEQYAESCSPSAP